MDKAIVKSVLYGSIVEMMCDTTLYVNYSPDPKFGNWSELGKKSLHEFIERISIEVAIANKADLDSRAKQMTLELLKKET